MSRDHYMRKRLFRKYFTGYMSVAIAFIFMITMFSAWLSVRQYSEQWDSANYLKLKQAQATLDENFYGLYRLTSEITQNRAFLSRNLASGYASIEANATLRDYAGSNAFVIALIMLYDDERVAHVYSSLGSMREADFDSFYMIEGLGLATLKTYVRSLSRPLFVTARGRDCFTSDFTVKSYAESCYYIMPLLTYSLNVPAVLICMIRPEQISACFSTLFGNMEYRASIVADTGETLLESGEYIGDGSAVAYEIHSDCMNWLYRVTVRQTGGFFGGPIYIYVAMLILALALGLALSVVMARRAYLPVRALVHRFGDDVTDDETEFDSIERLFESMREAIPTPEPAQLITLPRILTSYISEDTLRETYLALGIADEETVLCILLVRPAQTGAIAPSDVRSALEGTLTSSTDVTLISGMEKSADIVALLAWETQPARAELIKDIESAQAGLIAGNGSLSIIASRFFCGLDSAQRVFYQILYAAQYQLNRPNMFLDMEYLSVVRRGYIDMARHVACYDLYRQLLSGDMASAASTFEEILPMVVEPPSAANSSVLFLTLLSVFRQVNASASRDPELDHQLNVLLADGMCMPGETERRLRECMTRLTELLEGRKARLNRDAVVEQVRANFRNADFSLQMLADMYGVSAPTMSRYFKGEMGEGILTYVTEMRIAEAKRLLSDTDIPVKDIVSLVGYNDVNNFIRRFKATTGMTPTAYRGSPRDR